MSSNKAFQASVLSLQSDMSFLLGRRAVAKPVTTTCNNLDKVATTALKAKALKTTAQQQQQQQQQPSGPPHWSQGLIRPPQQDASLYWPSPHYWRNDGAVDPSASNANTSRLQTVKK